MPEYKHHSQPSWDKITEAKYNFEVQTMMAFCGGFFAGILFMTLLFNTVL